MPLASIHNGAARSSTCFFRFSSSFWASEALSFDAEIRTRYCRWSLEGSSESPKGFSMVHSFRVSVHWGANASLADRLLDPGAVPCCYGESSAVLCLSRGGRALAYCDLPFG
ncbi:hypothetical protein D3C71_1696950 [compost metagenome]